MKKNKKFNDNKISLDSLFSNIDKRENLLLT